MKQNFIRIVLLCCLLLGVFAFSTAAFADNGQQQLPSPGILPDSPFYFINKIGQDIGMFFTFGNRAKAEKALQYAGQSLAAARAMKARGKDNLVAETAKDYARYMQQVQDRLRSSSDNGSSGNLSERIALATGLHLTVLDGLSANLTGPAAQAVVHALQVSVNGQEQALDALAGHHAEQALKIAGDSINAYLQTFHDRMQQGHSGNLTSELDIAARLMQLEGQFSATAVQQGADPTALTTQITGTMSRWARTVSQIYGGASQSTQVSAADFLGKSINSLSTTNATVTGPKYRTQGGIEKAVTQVTGDMIKMLAARVQAGSGNLTSSGYSVGTHNP